MKRVDNVMKQVSQAERSHMKNDDNEYDSITITVTTPSKRISEGHRDSKFDYNINLVFCFGLL